MMPRANKTADFGRVLAVLAGMALGAMAVGCAPRSSAPQPGPGPPMPPGTPPAGARDCGVANVGPLLPITHDPSPAPPARGGVIHDGVYDLTHIVVFHSSKSTTRPAMRISMVLRTEERSSNHYGGSIWESIEEAPDVACRVRRFSVSGGSLRFSGQDEGESVYFTATPDSLTLFSQRGPEADVGLFYRRRR
ncbi:MAG: hypothetical protein JRI68_31300 [Deltaproteobacteria bacterium]|nr:hypothetical protein [Deltaproteobacteria bacterium]